MYCSSCGAAVDEGLTYCNRCGSKLRRSVVGLKLTGRAAERQGRGGESSQLSPNLLLAAIVWTFVGGLGAIIGLLAVMKSVAEFNPGLANGLTALSFLLLIAIESLLIGLLFRRIRAPRERVDTSPIEQRTSIEDIEDARALPPPPISVTEHTTRTIDPAYVERAPESDPQR